MHRCGILKSTDKNLNFAEQDLAPWLDWKPFTNSELGCSSNLWRIFESFRLFIKTSQTTSQRYSFVETSRNWQSLLRLCNDCVNKLKVSSLCCLWRGKISFGFLWYIDFSISIATSQSSAPQKSSYAWEETKFVKAFNLFRFLFFPTCRAKKVAKDLLSMLTLFGRLSLVRFHVEATR